MQKHSLSLTTRVGAEGPYRVDLPLDPRTLNERLFDIGVWLVERDIPHQARVLMEPQHERIRVSFREPEAAKAFRERFGARMN